MNEKISNILNDLKKPCHKIIVKESCYSWEKCDPNIFKTSCHIFLEGWKRDDDEREFVFQIFNNGEFYIPGEITKLQLFQHLDDSSMNLVVANEPEDNIAPESLKKTHGVLYFEPSHNLPDWKTIKELHPSEFVVINRIIQEENPDLKSYTYYEKYDEFIEQTLGHKNHYSFIGGNMNQAYELMNAPSDHFQFIMQIETECNGGDTVYIFQNKDDTSQYRIETAR